MLFPSAFWSLEGVHTFKIWFILARKTTTTTKPVYFVVLVIQKLTSRSFGFWRTAWSCHLPRLLTQWIAALRLRQFVLLVCLHIFRMVAQFQSSSSENSWKWLWVQARWSWAWWCLCEPCECQCRHRSALEQFTQGSTVAREEKARRARRKREGGVQLVIREQLLRPAFSVLLGENNSIKGTRGPMITEWGDRRQLPAWLWKPFQILKELPHIMCCSCWDHLGEMQNLAPTDPSGRKDSRITPMFSLDEFQSHLPPLAFFATEPSHSSSCISLCFFFFSGRFAEN